MKMRITGMAMMAALLAACGQAPEKAAEAAPAAAPAPATETPAATATVVESVPSIEDSWTPRCGTARANRKTRAPAAN